MAQALPTLDDLVALSRERIEKGSLSFAHAARLFAPDVRADAYMLYAWCRHCDDEIDGQELGHNREDAATAATEARLDQLRHKTVEAIEGRATEPIFLALQTVVARHRMPGRYPLELIEGMAMDVRGTRYETLEDTLRYSYHVAGCVGVMMATVMGVTAAATFDRASDLGIAFQLTNIARDVVADANVGRVYLPAAWLAEAGVAATAAAVAHPANRAKVHAVTLRLLDEADRYYDSAYYGIADLPVRSALAIAAARRVYRRIGDVVRARGAEGAEVRARVRKRRKLAEIAIATSDLMTAKTADRWQTRPARPDLWTMPRT